LLPCNPEGTVISSKVAVRKAPPRSKTRSNDAGVSSDDDSEQGDQSDDERSSAQMGARSATLPFDVDGFIDVFDEVYTNLLCSFPCGCD